MKTRRHALASAVLATGLLAGACGCGPVLDTVDGTWPIPAGAGGTVQADAQPPVLSRAAVAPDALRFLGGPVVVSADAVDNVGVARVWAEIQAPGQATIVLEMARGTGSSYSATWTAPGNARENGEPVIYTVRVVAQDDVGNAAAAAPLTFTIRSVPVPPEGPEL